MNAYDFDKTIYPRDSTADFYLWSLGHCPRVFLTLPRTLFAFTLMALRLRDKTRCKEIFYGFLRFVPAGSEDRFWQTRLPNLQSWYMAQKRPDDVIISASPACLLRPVQETLGCDFIASRVDRKTGKTTGQNCHGEEKVHRFRELYPEATVERFYSDALSDTPMANLAREAFLVRKGHPEPWPKSTS